VMHSNAGVFCLERLLWSGSKKFLSIRCSSAHLLDSARNCKYTHACFTWSPNNLAAETELSEVPNSNVMGNFGTLDVGFSILWDYIQFLPCLSLFQTGLRCAVILNSLGIEVLKL
jgi:hypothetical protein